MGGRRFHFHTKLLKLLASPLPDPDDRARRAVILRVLISAILTLLAIALASSVLTSFDASAESRANNALPLFVLAVLLIGYGSLFALVHKGRVQLASLLFMGSLTLLTIYLAARWGVDLPAAMLFYALLIVTAGILMGSRAALCMTIVLSCAVLAIQYLHDRGQLVFNSY